MSTATSQQGAGEGRLPAAYVVDIPRGSLFQLIAAWLLLTEGALALLFLPILSLTPEGRRTIREIRRRRDQWFAARLEKLTDDERAVLAQATALLERVAAE